MTVLYVDDDSDDREIFGSAIHAVNPNVIYREFDAGQMIIEFLSAELDRPDYIFIDINMPKMNGYECANEILATFGMERSKIVMFSTSFSPPDIERFKRMGVQMLQKAATYDVLIQNLQRLLAANPPAGVLIAQAESR